MYTAHFERPDGSLVNNMKKKIYVVRKYIIASSAQEALKIEPKTPVDDCWAEDETHKDFLKKQLEEINIGFKK